MNANTPSILRFAIVAMLMALALNPRAVVAADTTTIHSRSGQFIVLGNTVARANDIHLAQMAASGMVELDANLAAISAERLRAVFNRQLGTPEKWTAKVFLTLTKASRADTTAQITSTRFRDNWQYRLELLNPTTDTDFARALTQVLLQEYANRTGTERAAEIPLWLVVGLAGDLRAHEPDLLVRPKGSVWRQQSGLDPMSGPRRLLSQRPALTFEELSWPAGQSLSGERRQLFEASAHLLVNQLLRLPQGPAKMRRFIEALPRHLNWQIAFLSGFQQNFENLLAVEKWWAVNLAAVTGRNQWQMWPAAVALDKLAEVLRVDVETRKDAKSVPERSTVDLQTVIRTWDHARQEKALRTVLTGLAQIRVSLPPEMIRTVDDYRFTLETYLLKRPTAGLSVTTGVTGALPTRSNLLAFETARTLNALDAGRENFRALLAAARPASPGR